ncbi:MAG: aldo/keto reductase [Spirochaetia bacterium]|jgi:aryl-alcohol dehydrogenase-like predicted oxidoreductase|nr:aldo/keto reductase [Spirochaetia bacterium]
MEKITLGKSGLIVSRISFGALPIQRLDFDSSRDILLRALEGGINFFDTARGYSDSEEKIGYALSSRRQDIIIATKASGAEDRAGVMSCLGTSLSNLKTDYVDLLQLHNPPELPNPEDPDSLYAGLLEAREQGKTKTIGITNHSRKIAIEAARSGLYDTVQFPLSAISSDEDLELVEICRENNVGLIAMKAMCGGLLKNASLAFAGLRRYENVVPIWGIQKMEELEEFLTLEENPPVLDETLIKELEREKKELAGDFCRGCGYCLPCPADIKIPMAARMSFLLRRAPSENFLTTEWQNEMEKIEDCINCRACVGRCPYSLETPDLLKKMLADYRTFF